MNSTELLEQVRALVARTLDDNSGQMTATFVLNLARHVDNLDGAMSRGEALPQQWQLHRETHETAGVLAVAEMMRAQAEQTLMRPCFVVDYVADIARWISGENLRAINLWKCAPAIRALLEAERARRGVR